MPKYCVHSVWVDLLPARFGLPIGNAYGKSLNGTASRRAIGVWSGDGQFVYAEHAKPSEVQIAFWSKELEDLGADLWISKRVDYSSTWGAEWSLLESDRSAADLLAELTASFLNEHSPVESPAEMQQTGVATPTEFGMRPDLPRGEERLAHAKPAQRFVIPQSWWIASELVRRHPELVIHEMHPGGGSYDVLAVLQPGAKSPRVLASINRVGSIHVEDDPLFGWTWDEVFAAESPYEAIRALEAAMRLSVPARTPVSTPRTIAYRLIAAVLRLRVDDRHQWDARNDFIDSSGEWWPDDPDTNGYLALFPQAQRDSRDAPTIGLFHEPDSHYWALLRDDEPRLLVGIDGRAYSKLRSWDLRREYERCDGNLELVVANVLA